MKVIEELRKFIEPELNQIGLYLDEMVYEKENGQNYLRIVLDKEGYVNVEDCVAASDIINPILDEKDLIEESYILDVCSKEKGSEYSG